MKPCLERILLSEPLRSVRLASGSAAATAVEWEDRLRRRYEEGVRDGEKTLRDQLLRQRAELVELQNGVLQSLRQTLPQVRTECERALVDLALEVARKVVAGLPITAGLVESAVREALAHLEAVQDLMVLLNAEDLELLRQVNAPVLLSEVGGEKIRFEVSSAITRGGCMVQTRFGTVDARRETKFDRLQETLQA